MSKPKPSAATVVIVGPDEMMRMMVAQAEHASAKVIELCESEFEPGETTEERAVAVAEHAYALACAYRGLSTMAARERANDSSPQATEPDGQGCVSSDLN